MRHFPRTIAFYIRIEMSWVPGQAVDTRLLPANQLHPSADEAGAQTDRSILCTTSAYLSDN